jgi:ubiquinone/menaquinone biosynthesis C-methylase UbiE
MQKAEISNYDQSGYDYTKYWIGRQYEDKIEHQTVSELLPQKGSRILDVGGSFGRLADVYCPRFDEAVILDFSQIALDQALERATAAGFQNLEIKQGDAYNIPFDENSFDTAMMVRVMHHLEKPEAVFQEIHRILKPGGTFVLEVANKIHAKATLKAWAHGDFSFRSNQTPFKHQTTTMQQEGIFYNYHPEDIQKRLLNSGFTIERKRSVSLFRLPFLKSVVPESLLVSLDRLAQPLASPLYLGPSVWFQCRLQK